MTRWRRGIFTIANSNPGHCGPKRRRSTRLGSCRGPLPLRSASLTAQAQSSRRLPFRADAAKQPFGLSLVHRIVADLGGVIDVRTTVGRGTTFTIWLPTAGEVTAPSAKVTTELPHGDGQTVMIVDGEKPLVALAEEILAKLGYEPVGFNTSGAALDAFREAPQRFDIVLTDETMPQIVGPDIAREIRLLRLALPMLLIS